MRDFTVKHIAIAAAAFAVLSIALLWSWNTLAALFGAPSAEFRHVLACMVAAVALRSLVTRNGSRQRR
jgi:hypothetical protein